MPRQVRSVKKTGKCTIPCTDHTDKVIEFYCPTHYSVSCSVCTVLQHKPCTVSYIPDIAGCYKSDREYNEFKDNLKIMEENADYLRSASLQDIQEAIESTYKAMKDVQDYRVEINTELDNKEKKLMELGRKLKAEQKRRMESKTEDSETLKSEIVERRQNVESFESNDCDLFVRTKQIKASTDQLQAKLEQNFKMRQTSFRYKFKRDQLIEQALSPDVEFRKFVKCEQQIKTIYSKQTCTGN